MGTGVYSLSVELVDVGEGGEDEALLALEGVGKVTVKLGVVRVHGEREFPDVVSLRLP